MKTRKMLQLIDLVLALSLIILLVPSAVINADASVNDSVTTVAVSAPAGVSANSDFTAVISVSSVTNLNSAQFDLSFDPSVIQVVGSEGGQGVTSGLIGATVFPCAGWTFQPTGTPGGTIRDLGHISGVGGATGSGYLAQVNFHVKGIPGQSTGITLSTVLLYDSGVNSIPVTLVNGLVNVIEPLEITTSVLPEGVMGQSYSASLAATGGVSPYHWSASGLPGGLSVTGNTITGVPSACGDFNVSITVQDSAIPANSQTKALELHIYPALQITTSSLAEGVIGHSYTAILEATGGKSPYSWSAFDLPGDLSFSSGGAISGSPSAMGDYNLNFTVSDSFSPANTVSKSLTLHVTSSLEIATCSLPDGVVGRPYDVVLNGSGGIAPYSWSVTGLPGGLAISGNTITGTPEQSGNFSVGITLVDSASPVNSRTATLGLHVYPALQIATLNLPDGKKGVTYSASLSASGGKGSYTWSAGGLPDGMAVSTNGALSGTPSVSGDFTLDVSVTDSFSPPDVANGTVTLKIYLAGDANGDGDIGMGDVTKVERIILGLDPPTLGADANGDGYITIGDVTKIELIILGL